MHTSIEDIMGRKLVSKEGVPFALHVDGPLSLPLPSPRIAVVGMRKPALVNFGDLRRSLFKSVF